VQLEVHRSLPGWAEAALLAWLPRSELAVSLRPSMTRGGVVAGDGAAVAIGVVVEGRGALSGAEVVLACAGRPEGAGALADTMGRDARAADGVEVVGPAAIARPVAAALAERTGGSVTTVMGQRLLVATEVVTPQAVSGQPRRMVATDVDLVGTWLDDFAVEALGHDRRGVAMWRERLADTDWQLWLWEHEGRPVSLVNARPTTAVSSRIGPVYTPPTERGRGYAAALTAAATQACLTRGDERVTLFTDVENPTSNALYLRVGFVDVCAHGSWLVEA